MRKFWKIALATMACMVAFQIYLNVRGILRISKTFLKHSGRTNRCEKIKQISGVTKKDSVSNRTDGLPACPETPPGLVGQTHANEKLQKAEYLEKKFSYLKVGGHYSPPNCTAVQRLAIIIPYRNRWSHLHILLNNLVPFLVRQQASFTIFVIEQALNDTFNRAMLLNIGLVEALKRDNYTCLVIHDVDLIPLNDHNLYRCGPRPKHIAVAINKFRYRVPYPGFFGGVVAMTPEQVKAVNGFSNLYFGWGGEDDDLRKRAKARYKTLTRSAVNVARFKMISHKRDKGNEKNRICNLLLQKGVKRMSVDGLNSLVYKVNSVELKTLYTSINVSINQTEVMKRAPKYVLKRRPINKRKQRRKRKQQRRRKRKQQRRKQKQ